jgi:hypothetical protein
MSRQSCATAGRFPVAGAFVRSHEPAGSITGIPIASATTTAIFHQPVRGGAGRTSSTCWTTGGLSGRKLSW